MPEVGTGFVTIKPDLDGFGRTLDRGIGPEIGRASGGISSKFKGMFTSIAALGGGILGAVAVGGFLKGAVAEAQEAAKIGRLTEAVVKSTGGAANVSADQLGKLSERLSNIAAVDDEVIQGAGNVLLTFTKVRNEIGEGNNIFDRTTEAALNMSAALGTDLQGSTMQLGKALNDPIKGITALSRAGVSFTEQQKEQIKAMVAAGDTLGAQKIILAEMETQFGGAAAAAADPMERLGVIAGNLQERLGTALLPVIEKVATWLGRNLPGFVDAGMRAFSRIGDAVGIVKDALQALFSNGDEDPRVLFAEWMTGIFGADSQATFERLGGAILAVKDGLVAFAGFITDSLWPAVQRVVEAIGGWGNALAIIGAVVATAVAPLAVLAAGVVYAYTQFDFFRNIVDAVVSWFKGTAIPAIVTATEFVVATFEDLRAYVDRIWPAIREAIGHAIRVIKEVIGATLDAIAAVWRAWGDDLLNIAKTAFEFVREAIDNVLQVIRGIIQTVTALINGEWGQAWDGFKQILAGVWDQITNIIDTALALIASIIGGALSMLSEVWSGVWDKMKGAVSGALDGVVGFFTGLPGRIGDALNAGAQRLIGLGKAIISRIIDGIKSVAGGIGSAILDAIPGGNAIGGAIGRITGIGKSLAPGTKSAGTKAGVADGLVGDRFGDLISVLDPAASGAMAGMSVADWTDNFRDQLNNLVSVFRDGDDVANGAAEVIDNMFGNTGKLIPVVMSSTEQLGNLATVMTESTDVANGLAEVIDNIFGNTGRLISMIHDAVPPEFLGSRPTAAVDARIHDIGEMAERIKQIFTNRGVEIATDTETAAQRIMRLVNEVMQGRSLDSIRASVDWLARQNRAHTGGWVTPRGIEPLRVDELYAKLQHGEAILSRDQVSELRGGMDTDGIVAELRELRAEVRRQTERTLTLARTT